MIRKEELERYARMLLRVGLGLRKGQEFMIKEIEVPDDAPVGNEEQTEE